ncbi:MAG TPA: (Fe-S)-binding protein [Tepidisphaeraceae bacterium]|nr:(Fe-S)-binding protein [Tepidisphaeraceae bacterium]
MAYEVALFTTCLVDQLYPQMGIAISKILEHFGCVVQVPAGQKCCGRPLYVHGYHDQARELAKGVIELFEHYDFIVTPSAACCMMIRQHYPRLFRGDIGWDRGVRKLSQHTYEFVEFLEKVLKVDFSLLKLPQRVTGTYHPSCCGRGIRSRSQTEQILREIRNFDYRPMPSAEQSCGSDGVFALNHPAISGAIAREAVDNIAATGASTVICDEAECVMNLSGTHHRQSIKTPVKHISELIAEALKIDVTQW